MIETIAIKTPSPVHPFEIKSRNDVETAGLIESWLIRPPSVGKEKK